MQRERLGAQARRLGKIRVELHAAIALVHAQPAPYAQPLPGLDPELDALAVAAPHHRGQHRLAITQRKIQMARRGLRDLRDLAFEPDQP